MEAKLIKEGSFGYKIKFYNDDDMAACALGLLSLKNCKAIELGYDLDELVKSTVNQNIKRSMEDLRLRPEYTKYAKAGFQKALEILGDKKFSEKDVISMIEKSRETGLTAEYLILNNQQTEWDVEIVGSGTVYKTVLDCCTNHHPKFGCTKKDGCFCISNELPKLDADGCLILKRK